MPSPIVLDGMRAQRGARDAAVKAAVKPTIQPPPGDGVCYFSRIERYRVQITTPPEITDPVTGRKKSDIPVAVQFEAHYFRNNNPNKQMRKVIDEALQSNAQFGWGKHFWLEEEDRQRRRESHVSTAVRAIEADPEVMAEIEKRVALRMGKSEDLPSAQA